MSLPLPENFVGLSLWNGERVTRAAWFRGNLYLFTSTSTYTIRSEPSWLSRKWTAVKHRFQRWWEVGWEIPQ